MWFNELRRLRKTAGITQDALAMKLGVNRATISKYEAGQIEPTLSQLQAIADALGVHLFDLLGVGAELDKYVADLHFPEGSKPADPAAIPMNPRELYNDLSEEEKREFLEVLRSDEALKIAPSDLSEEAQKIARSYDKMNAHGKGAVRAILNYEEKELSHYSQQEDGDGKLVTLPKSRRSGPMVQIRVYDQPAAAGLGNYLDEPAYHVEQYPPSVIPAQTDFGVVISGDSMEPKVHNGGTVFVQAAPNIEPGKIGIFVLNGQAYCKKLMVDQESRTVRLVSLNPKYEDIVVDEDSDTFRTLGRVLGQWTPGHKQDLFGW